MGRIIKLLVILGFTGAAVFYAALPHLDPEILDLAGVPQRGTTATSAGRPDAQVAGGVLVKASPGETAGGFDGTLDVVATVEPASMKSYYAQTGGVVQAVYVREGEAVRPRSSDIISFDTSDLEFKLTKAEESVITNRLQLAQARSALAMARARFEENRKVAGLAALPPAPPVDSDALAERIAARAPAGPPAAPERPEGFDDAIISYEEYRASEAAWRDASASVDLALWKLKTTETAVEQAEYEIARARVTADTQGVVAELLVREGDYIGAGTKVATVVDPARLMARIYVPARYLPLFRKKTLDGEDLAITVTTEAFELLGGEAPVFAAHLDYLSPVINPNSSAFLVKLRIDSEPMPRAAQSWGQEVRLSPGMLVTVRFEGLGGAAE